MKTKMMIVLAILFSLQSFGQTVGQIFASGGINYRITSATEVEVAPNLPADITGNLTIPKYVNFINNDYLVTAISLNSFRNCVSLTGVLMPDSVSAIGVWSFAGCTGLVSLTLTDSVVIIGNNAFESCRNLTSLSLPNSLTNIGNYAFSHCTFLTSVTLGTSLTNIGVGAFRYCTSLTAITIPNSVTFIGSRAFEVCSNLTSFTFPNSIAVINSLVLGHCYNLTSVTIPNSVTSIAPLAFVQTRLRDVIIPRSVTSIGARAFSLCTNLSSFTVNWTTPISIDRNVFENSPVSRTILNVPRGTEALYDAALVWTEFLTQMSPLSLYTVIPDNNFERALFDKGIDTVLGDNRVLTAAIVNIPTLDVSNKAIADLTGIETFYALVDLNCEGNLLTSLNISTVLLLQKLNCNKNQIASLDLSNQSLLSLLRCESNLLTTINIGGISNLQEVYCGNNLMTALDFTAQTNLQKLYCSHNQLAILNISGLRQLQELSCGYNRLSTLSVKDARLSLLYCGNNRLTNIDYKFQEPTLSVFNCEANLLTNMDLRCFRTVSDFNCSENPFLNCISVDDVAYATANYLKDATASFSSDCYGPLTVSICQNTAAVPLVSPFVAGIPTRWYTTATAGTASVTAPTPATNSVGTRIFYVSQVWAGVESRRIAITVNILGIPAAPAAITGTAAQGALVGTSTTAVYSIAPVANATSYNWTVPAGVTIVSGQGTTTLTVNFSNVSAGAGTIGNLMVVAVNAQGCSTRLARTLTLSKALPTAPTAIRMTDAALTIPTSGIPTAVTNISRYIGQPTVLTLTATLVAGVTTYEWELPAGVNVLSGATAVRGGALGGNVITVNFEGVTTAGMFNFTTTSGILTHVLRIGVRSITGVGASTTSNAGLVNPTTANTARLLTLTATAPRASSSIRMTDAMAVDPTRAITVMSTFIGTPKTLTLTATPVATANQYNWELPAGVNQLSGGTSNVITVNFANVAAGTTSLYLGVKAVNAAGESVTSNASLVPATNSTARLLRLSATVPATVPAVTGQVVGLCGKNAYTYTISPSALATSYEITAPVGSKVTSKDKATNGSNVIKTSDLEFTVVYPEKFATTKETPASISVIAVNGVGKSAIARTLGVTTELLRRDRLRAVPHTELSIQAKLGFGIVRSESPAFINYMTDMQRVWAVNDGVEIVSGQGTDEIGIDYRKVLPAIKSTKVSMYYKNSCGVVSLPITITIILEPIAAKRAETLTIEATEVYPNPVVDNLSIDVTASKVGILDLAIYSLEGIQVANAKTFALKEGTNTITENISNLAKGIYIVQLLNTSNNELITKKLIKN